ncbi:hypothetical protein RvY_03710 [Ramazzottius varieornatus]|uniref:SUEL-type lectin domain-containing protein n=1 Tax=Ramazzottius varieornatus TaxID=947166 RepID=A0A1D1UP24_RAMVA|nr:hypothetical protein RvY_03710 [Ramazzottius varieornatus]
MYRNQSPKSNSSSSDSIGEATPCNSNSSIRNTIRSLCKNKSTCLIKASDDVLLGFNDPTCKTRRPLVVEYQCAAPGETPKTAMESRIRGAMISELL